MTEHFGYAGDILRVDLSSGTVSSMPTKKYADGFLGFRGKGPSIRFCCIDLRIGKGLITQVKK